MFNHDTRGGFFSNQDDVTSKNSDNPDAYLFSILDQLESYRGSDGNFTFLVCYPELKWGVDGKVCNEWIQSSNPLTESTIIGFQPISLAFTLDSYRNDWRGIGRSPSSFECTTIDDSPSQSNCYTAIGAITNWPTEENLSIPGPCNEIGSNNPSGVTKVTLYVKENHDVKLLKGKHFIHILK